MGLASSSDTTSIRSSSLKDSYISDEESADDNDETNKNQISLPSEETTIVLDHTLQNLFNNSEIINTKHQSFDQATKQNITYRYKILQKLVGGATGTVYKCSEMVEHTTIGGSTTKTTNTTMEEASAGSGKFVVVKKMPFSLDLQNSMEINQELLSECLELHTKHILRLLNCFEIRQEDELFYFTVSEYCERGNLRNLMQLVQGRFSISLMMQWIFQILMAIRFLNSKQFVHRDLKLDNIFVRYFEGEKLNVILGDLGTVMRLKGEFVQFNTPFAPSTTSTGVKYSKGLEENTISETAAQTGTPGYRDPFSIQENKIHLKSDIWSLGITILKVLFFDEMSNVNFEQVQNQMEVYDFIEKHFSTLENNDSIWRYLKIIVKGMLTLDIEQRFSIEEILGEIFTTTIEKISPESLEENFQYLREPFKNHESIIWTTISQNGLALQYLTDKLRDKKEIVLRAIEQNAWSYEFASNRLKNESEIIIKAHIKDVRIKHLFTRKLTPDEEGIIRQAHYLPSSDYIVRREDTISEQERNDLGFIEKLILKDGKLLEIASPNLKNNSQIVLKSVSSNGLALQFASAELRGSRDIVEVAIEQDPMALAYTSESLRNDFEIVKKAVSQNGLALEFASKSLKNNKEIVKMAVIQNYKSITYIPSQLISNDPIFICSILTYDVDAVLEFEKHWYEKLDICEWVIQRVSGLPISKLKTVDHNLLVLYTIMEENNLINVDDFNFILECYNLAAKKDHPYALYKLATIYYYGEVSLAKNTFLALKYFEKSAELGFVPSQLILSSIFARPNEMVSEDMKKSFQYTMNAAKQGNSIAQYNLSRMYLKGTGIGKNEQLCMVWLRRAARNGHQDSQFLLGLEYYKNDADHILAYEWFSLSAEQGNEEAQQALAEMLISGEGCTKNIQQAVKWFKKAAKNGKASAMLNLGLIYCDSPELKNYDKAFKWYLRGAENGNVDSQHNVGYCYFQGLGVKQDYYKSFSWFVEAHANGHKSSLHNIMVMIAKGNVSMQNKEVMNWAFQEAMKGTPQAMALLEVYDPSLFQLIKQGGYKTIII